MTLNRFHRLLLGALAACTLMLAPACKKSAEEKEIKDLSQKAMELDKATQQQQLAGGDQMSALKKAGASDVRLSPETMQLTEEQKRVLEERIKTEKNSSYQALLQDVIDKDKEIKELNDKIKKLREILPKPDVAKQNDSHYHMALRFLRKKGLGQEEAARLVSRVNLMETLAPGFEVYHFYSNGVYGTWVAQGKSKISPNELQRQEKEKIENERDSAVAQGEKLQEEVNDLLVQKEKITAEINALASEKAKMIEEMNALSATNESQKAKLNSMHYVVGDRKKLEKDGIIVVPVFAKDRAGKNWADNVFDKALDLRSSDTITIKAADIGVQKISKVSVVPGSLVKDEHYSLVIAEDKTSATIKILRKDRFKNEKVVFAVAE